MTNACCGLAVIFCSFISLLISRETNILEIFSGVHGFTGKTVKFFKLKITNKLRSSGGGPENSQSCYGDGIFFKTTGVFLLELLAHQVSMVCKLAKVAVFLYLTLVECMTIHQSNPLQILLIFQT